MLVSSSKGRLGLVVDVLLLLLLLLLSLLFEFIYFQFFFFFGGGGERCEFFFAYDDVANTFLGTGWNGGLGPRESVAWNK